MEQGPYHLDPKNLTMSENPYTWNMVFIFYFFGKIENDFLLGLQPFVH